MLRSSLTGDFDERKPAMFKHSPAPWNVYPGDELDELQVVDANTWRVATVFGDPKSCNPGPQQDQLRGDAQLIAAAPQMYALLRQIMSYMHDVAMDDDPLAEKIAILLNNIEESW
jgi:hypothetical protein